MNTELQFWMNDKDEDNFRSLVTSRGYRFENNSIRINGISEFIIYCRCEFHGNVLCSGRIAIFTECPEIINAYRKIARIVKNISNNNVFGHGDIDNPQSDVKHKYPTMYVGKMAETDLKSKKYILKQFASGKVVFTVEEKMV